ncbi:MAG: hypothetical protein AAF996_05130 [Pseudomonadota bacterium]
MISRTFIGLLVFAVVACESVPATLDPVLFEGEFTLIDENPSITASEAQISTFLARTDLTPAQRADVLFLRAEKRLDARYDLPGALADFDAFIAANPEDPRVGTAERRKIFARSEIDSAQRRLAQLQNLPNWFDDKVLMGDVEPAAARYRKSGLTPNAAHVYLLKEEGYICDSVGDDASPATPHPVHNYGPLRDDVEGAVWCDDPSVS